MDDQAIVTMKDNADITGDNYADALNVEGVKIAVQSGSSRGVRQRELPRGDRGAVQERH
ncbi:MAG: hypothetical protein ACLSVD_18260 [Eggerthellaceae bacterium]